MSTIHHSRSVILEILLIAWVLGSSSIVIGQSPEIQPPAADSSKEALPPVPTPSQDRQLSIRKFSFKHAKAGDVLKILQQLEPEQKEVPGFAVDERTNSFIVQLENNDEARLFEELCTLLDAETSAPGDNGKGLSISVPALGPQPLTFDFSFGNARGESIATLKQRYNELEQQAHQLADKLKQSKSPSESERSELQAAVRKSFEARQALQRAELADLAQRMQSMQQSIDMRDKLADKVIERRVEDLLNPKLKWDAGKVSEQLVGPNQSSSNAVMPLPPSPLPASVSAPYVPGEPPATVIRKRIQGRWIVQTFSVGDKDALPEFAGQVEVVIDGNSMRYLVGKQELTGPIFLANCKEPESPTLAEDGPLPIDFIHKPNGDPQTSRGIIACDETTLSICMASDEGTANKDFRPLLFVPGTKVILIKCRRAEPETAKAVSVDQSTWRSAVQQATSKLLLAYRAQQNIDPNESPKVIALIDVDYQGKQEAGDLKEEIYEWIENDVPVVSPGRFTLLSRRFVDLAMMETKLSPSDLESSSPSFLENRQRILEKLKRHDVKLDSLLITSLKHMGDFDKTRQNQFELTLEGFIDAQTSWFERVTFKGKANGPLKEPESNSPLQFATPQELLAGLDDFSKNGMHEEFVTLFGDDGIRDLAGSLLISAVQLSESVEYAKNHGADTETAIEESVTKVREVLGKWLPGNATAEAIATMRGLEQQAVNEAFGTGEAPTDDSSLKVFVTAVRKSSERITNHRKFAVEIMRAFDGMTNNKFAYFDQGNTKAVWQVSQFGDRALGTLVDGTASFATITLERAKGTWRISSMFNELLTMTNANAEREKPSTPAMEMQQRLQGEWNVKVFQSDGEGSEGQALQVVIRGNILLLQTVVNGKVIGAYPHKLVWPNSDHPHEVDVIHDPNANKLAAPGRIACDNNSFQIVFGGPKNVDGSISRPSEICPGENAVYIDCVRNIVDHRRAPKAPLKTLELSDADLSTPQATLDTIHHYSVDHPMGVPVECFTEPALRELSGVMLQQLCFMSGLSQVGLQTGGVIGVKDNAPMVAGTPPSFHLSVDALIKDHSLPTPPEESTKAFELLAKLTLGAAFSSDESLVKPDRELFRLAAGILKSPKEFLPKAGELSERFNDISGDNESPKKESKAQPKYLIKIDGDEATATQIVDSDKPSVPMSFKLQRINQRWLVSEAFSDEILNQMISSMSQVLGAMSAIESEVASQRDSSDSKKAPNADKPLYSGHSISWWLDSYWDNATASPRTTENETQEYVASEAIRKLRELPECKAAIEAALEKWFELVEHEVNEGQLTRVAKCIVLAAGPKNQKLAVAYLFEIAKRGAINPGEENLGKWIDGWDDELDKAVKELVLNDELATQIADRLQTGNSAQRRFAVTFLLNRGASKQTDTPDQTEANAWFRSHDKLFYPAFEAALQDSSEAIRMFALIVLTGIDPHHSQLPFQLKKAVEYDPSTQVRCVAIDLLCSKELASSIEAQSAERQPLLTKTLEADSSIDVRCAALGALMAMDKDSELVHATLLEWARCKERLQVEHALSLMHRNHEAGDRPQSIDELIELLSDPEWGTTLEVKQNSYRWARQYAIAILGEYAAHAHRALPTLEAELARNNKDTLSFATEAIDSVRGYCPDRPIDQLQGQWEFVSVSRPSSSTPFFDFPLHPGGVYPAVGREIRTASPELPPSIINVSGTQLKLGGRVLAEISHQRQNLEIVMLLDPDGKKRHCNGRYEFKGGPSPEYKPNATPNPELLILEICELQDDSNATQVTKQTFEFRPVKK